MNYKLVFFLILLITLPLISSETSFFVQNSEEYDLKVSCEIGGARCSSGNCNITIEYPNSSILVDDGMMYDLGNGYFNYTLNENLTTPNGEYKSRAECFDGNLNGTTLFTYEVNPTGIRPSDQKTDAISRGIWFLAIIAVLLFIAFLFVKTSVPVKWTFFGLSMLFFLATLNILFVGLQDEVVNPRLVGFFEGFTVISWIMFWFIGGLLIIMWILTFLQTFFLKQNLDQMRRFGMQ